MLDWLFLLSAAIFATYLFIAAIPPWLCVRGHDEPSDPADELKCNPPKE